MNILQNSETGKFQAFRPNHQLRQFLQSCNHIDMPLFDTNELLKCIQSLVQIDKDWYPHLDDPAQFYLRMTHISTDPLLGVKSPAQSKIYCILNPTTLKSRPLSLKCSDGVNKAWPLGHAQYTLSGNLGPLVPYIYDAKQNGYDDVLWLLDDYVQDMTVLNVFFVLKNRYGNLELATPKDNGCILPSNIRNSILSLKDKIREDTGMRVNERQVSIHEMMNAYYEGRLIEVIGCSTSSIIQPINRITYRDQRIRLETDGSSKYTSYLSGLMQDVMMGPTSHKWITAME
uniref:Uncharacterized protein n=1 Tax=Strombidium inclinatum TaxID=197538 RepID=A0A7S3IPF6_9SPIT|mmetsp:Transcript_29667/g.45224  ORF Transcript_29667/g.45224 Transcript_29667/m.45224 type:complete len:287 (+) Transcript_29667:356-1216(+)